MAQSGGPRSELLEALCANDVQDSVMDLLLSAEVRIAVPCSVLIPGGSGGSKAVVTILKRGSAGCTLALGGSWWKGAPSTPYLMDYRQLLQHANDDTLRMLHRKLAGASRSRNKSLLRTQSGPSRFLLDQLTSSRRSSEDGGSSGSLRRTKSGMPEGGAAPPGLQRTKSGTRLPAGSAGSSLRRTSSSGVASASAVGRAGGGSVRGGGSLHRLSASQPDSAAVEEEGGVEGGESLLVSPQQQSLAGPAAYETAAAGAADEAADGFVTPLQAEPRLHRLSLEDSASAAHDAQCLTPSRLSIGSQQSLTGGSDGRLGTTLDSPVGSAGGSRCQLSRQGTFSQPYFADLEGEELQAAAACTAGSPAAGLVYSSLAAAAEREGSTGSAPVALLGDRGTEEGTSVGDIHKVCPSFTHIFIPPWVLPNSGGTPSSPPPRHPAPHLVRCYRYREAAAQTGTALAAEPRERGMGQQGRGAACDAAEHLQAFQQHLAASLPHLALALTDMHHSRGGNDPGFVKGQLYLKALLQVNDELGQVGEQLRSEPSDGGAGDSPRHCFG